MKEIHNIIDTDNIRLLIFDCDGTLMDTLWAHYNAWNDTFMELNHTFISEAEFVSQYAGTSGEELITILNERFDYSINPKQAVVFKGEIFNNKYVEKVKPIAKVLSIVKYYENKVPMVVASGGQGDMVRKMLKLNNLSEYFKDVIAIEEVNAGKPSPELFLKVANRQKILPEYCLVFEDAEAGFIAARNAKMKFIDINLISEKN